MEYNISELTALARRLLLLTVFDMAELPESKNRNILKDFDHGFHRGQRLGSFNVATITKAWYKLELAGFLKSRKSKGEKHTLADSVEIYPLLAAFNKKDRTLLSNYSRHVFRMSGGFYWSYRGSSEKVSDVGLQSLFKAALVLGDVAFFDDVLRMEKREIHSRGKRFDLAYSQMVDELFDASGTHWDYISDNLVAGLSVEMMHIYINGFESMGEEGKKRIEDIVSNRRGDYARLLLTYAMYQMMMGRFNEAERLLARQNHYHSFAGKAALLLLQGDYGLAAKEYARSIKAYVDEDGYRARRRPFPSSILFYLYYFLRVSPSHLDAKELDKALNGPKLDGAGLCPSMNEMLEVLYQLAKNKSGQASRELLRIDPELGLETILYASLSYWLDTGLTEEAYAKLVETLDRATKSDYRWVAMEAAHLLSKFEEEQLRASRYEKQAREIKAEINVAYFSDLYPRMEAWERTAFGLENFFENKKEAVDEGKEERLVVMLDERDGQPDFEIKIQKISKRGGWTRGRKASRTSLGDFLRKNADLNETRILNALMSSDGYHSNKKHIQEDLYVDIPDFLRNLVGFGHIYHKANNNVRLELRKEDPKVFMEERDGEVLLQINHLPVSDEGYELVKTGPAELTLVLFSPQQLEFLTLFSKNKIVFPASAGSRVVDFVDRMRAILPVETVLEEDLSEYPRQPGDARPHIHLLPVGDTFRMEMFSKPYPEGGQYFVPGEGRGMFKQEIAGQIHLVERDLAAEKTRAASVAKQIDLPDKDQVGQWQWDLAETEDCLSVLNKVHPLRIGGQLVVEWPKGQKFKLLGGLSLGDLDLRISKGKDYWFDIDGEMRVNENMVFSFQQLLALTENSKSGFVEVEDGQFMAITEQLKKKLDLARNVLQKGKKGKMKFHNLAGMALDEVFEEAQLVSDEAWEEQRQRIAKAKNIRPRKPKGFKADLRPYQKEGFRWMMQLAEWGVGGCLADDMGLGKTVQALAVLAARASQGPALVVAPASVCRNWLREAEKFTPGLNPLLFGPGDRDEMIAALGKGDLLIASYGLMQSEIDKLKEVSFNMVILDEAQAIKNYATKRFKAAVQLSAPFRLATTGTPVENHLGELWSLFAFINPGLLGSKKMFAERYGKPIQREEENAVEQLKTLVKPFILRRRKSEVLKDLPPKTEIVHTVTLPDDEMAFYEAYRRHALEKLAQDMKKQAAGAQHLLVLAQITKLRRACCHPNLVDPKSKFPGAKLEAFKEIIGDLRENDHRVLVFSQFVDYLKIVEEWVKKEGISYQYLDGSTALKKREKAVKAFQSGEGELFLISLKAGGVGLNLTAADYVIILDPWWNPAVEDQAADRAHRIGQQNPVTVYRLVAENTIEEKIVQLHQQKRDLADSLLSGTDGAGKITTEDLLDILKQEREAEA